jgi:hypothetical protein
MLSTPNAKFLERNGKPKRSTNLRGRLRYDLGEPRFRCWVQIYDIEIDKCPSIFDFAIERNRKVRYLIQTYYATNSTSVELSKWAKSAQEILEEILPESNRLPTHFLMVGIEVEGGKEEPIFKIYLSLENGLRSPADAASEIGLAVFHYFETKLKLSHQKLGQHQYWVLDCLLAKWRLLRI